MICNDCNLKKICKVYDMAVMNTEIGIQINTCIHKPINIAMTGVANFDDNVLPLKQDIKLEEVTTIPEPRVSRADNNLTELSNKIRFGENNKSLEIMDISEEDYFTCSCGETKALQLINCSKCNEEICETCSTVSVDELGKIQHLCEQCWNKEEEEAAATKPKKKSGRPKKQKEVK